MSRTAQDAYDEQKEIDLERQWIENYKKYRRMQLKAEKELSAE